MTLLNTADFYGMGHNESLVSRAIKGRRDQAFLSVKCGMLRSPAGAFLGIDGRPNAVKNFAAYSLQRLGVDVIDLYQPARPDPSVPYEETIGAIADLIKEGKVRYLGVSEVGAGHLRRATASIPSPHSRSNIRWRAASSSQTFYRPRASWAARSTVVIVTILHVATPSSFSIIQMKGEPAMMRVHDR